MESAYFPHSSLKLSENVLCDWTNAPGAQARAAVGLGVDFEIDSPATPERVRMACAGPITKQFYDSDECYRAKLTC